MYTEKTKRALKYSINLYPIHVNSLKICLQILFIHSNFSTRHLTNCFLHPVPKYKHIKTQNCNCQVKYQKYKPITITKGRTSMFLSHKHTDGHLKQKRQEILRVSESYLCLNRIVCYPNPNVHFVSYKTHMNRAYTGKRTLVYITQSCFRGPMPNIPHVYGSSFSVTSSKQWAQINTFQKQRFSFLFYITET